jgi:conjugative relaxase-like TrwC/TraI family protein
VNSISKLGAGHEDYYLGLALGIEDYYLGVGEAPGRWLASGSADLGLVGVVEAEDLRAVLRGRDPVSGQRLTRGNRKVPGFDATFSAPKSVSLLYALGPAGVRGEVVAAHDTAVSAAVGYLEDQAAYIRRGHNGIERIAASGFVAAGFRHRTSRAGDPQLHTHVLIANLGRGRDGRWNALDGRGLYLHKMDAGAIYQAQLRAELTRRLGVEWGPVNNGPADLAGIPARVLREFSRRRAEIEAVMATRGETSARAAEVATLATRKAKVLGIDYAALAAEWQTRAAALGFGEADLARLVGENRELDPPRIVRSRLGDTLTEYASYFDRRHVIRALANAATTGADVADIESTADRFLRSPGVVALADDGVVGPRYSTKDLIKTERAALSICTRSRGAGLAVVDGQVVLGELAARPSMGDDQVAMVERLTMGGAAVDVVVGPAGTGKTFALDAARAAWQAAGYRVVGGALAARAAAQLEAGSGIPSFTIASLTRHLAHERLPARSVLVIDEAGMVGTRTLAEILRHTRTTGTKVVLVGDDRQLPEINAGGLFAALAREPSAIHLSQDHRHRDPAERRALSDLRAGRVAAGVTRLSRRGRITIADNTDVLRDQLVADWHGAVDGGQVALMLARRRSDVADLNRRARRSLIAGGYLDSTTERVVGGVALCDGDWVVATRNRRSLGVVNGDLGVVVTTTDDSIKVRLDRGVVVDLPGSYVADHLRHGYALTIHKAQGATCDATFVLGDETLALESGYTALSRGRDRNQLYVMDAVVDDVLEPHGRTEPRRLDLVTALKRSESQVLASDLGVEL